ncbi:stage III sporulation protein AD [Natranaerofaba carboxydovora]|uniref:stage III sporulation protein AD n=1 Tax=Natranaerofaba carboxydovora TaxID=2742683 RepID=UPI001F136162|nr:stage III sporulation protein AD [Natranaerofaba carboxydovora]UMZ73960.1 Stage III sporulation protein AC/AD protein family protein [Natranaerofaba carboxydovora]
MSIIQIVTFGIIAAILSVTLRQYNREMALLLSVAAGIVIFLQIVEPLVEVLDIIEELTVEGDIEMRYVDTLLRIIGVAYITEFGAQVCKDADEETIAKKIEFAGKIIIMLLAVPLIIMILETVMRLLP